MSLKLPARDGVYYAHIAHGFSRMEAVGSAFPDADKESYDPELKRRISEIAQAMARVHGKPRQRSRRQRSGVTRPDARACSRWPCPHPLVAIRRKRLPEFDRRNARRFVSAVQWLNSFPPFEALPRTFATLPKEPSMPPRRYTIALPLLSLIFASAAPAQTTVTLQQSATYSGAPDNWIICCDSANTNFGTNNE